MRNENLDNNGEVTERYNDVYNKKKAGIKDLIRLSKYKVLIIIGNKNIASYQPYEEKLQLLALQEVFLEMHQRDIPCYIFNRVGLISKSHYTNSAKRRMKFKMSFPKMYQDISRYEDEFKELLGREYSHDYVEQLGKIPQVIKYADRYIHEDNVSQYINVIMGKRVNPASENKADKQIHIFGRCGVFGYAVEDKDTFPNQLQKLLNKYCEGQYNVVNHGLWGGVDGNINHNIIMEANKVKKGDIVIVYMKYYEKDILNRLSQCGVHCFDTTAEYHQYPESRNSFYDRPGHMTKDGYLNIAKIIFKKLEETKFQKKKIDYKIKRTEKYTNMYIDNNREQKFHKELNIYLKEIAAQHHINDKKEVLGSIVMNCNPFTKGHRYLIEYAAQKVDRLFVFVLEEDKSFFKFKDRIHLVKLGTEDIKNVIVLASKEFMISAMTFPEYFMKDYVQEKEIDATKDLTIFCEHIAPALNISIRFVGEEPIDMITKQYNENMKNILPQYGIELLEIPRLGLDEENVISASKVRKLMKENNFEEIRKYVPETTYNFLTKNYKR